MAFGIGFKFLKILRNRKAGNKKAVPQTRSARKRTIRMKLSVKFTLSNRKRKCVTYLPNIGMWQLPTAPFCSVPK